MRQQTSLRRDSCNAKRTVSVLTLLWLPLFCSGAQAQDAPAQGGRPGHHTFTPGYTAKAKPMNGALRASVHTFKTEDGTPLYQSDDWYKSASDARSGLDKLAKKASRVIKEGTKTDANGRVIGKRLELAFSHRASLEMVIAWTDGSTVVRLSSTSLPLLLEFENQYYR